MAPTTSFDFIDEELGKAIPYGVYDIGANAGCVSVGVDHDTAEFAVNAISADSRRWDASDIRHASG